MACSFNRGIRYMRPTAIFLLAFYILTIFGRPAQALAEKLAPSDSDQLVELKNSLKENFYTAPLSQSQSATEVKDKSPDVSIISITPLYFKRAHDKLSRTCNSELNTSTKIHYCWSKICINAP
ncbi:hypothetical protein [Marivirga lumbricoides]|uniref:hypothetical protein n=1 Tax=Marivirga lumbricoides TaxID=1046115 RepID=UPI00166A1F89